MTRPSNTTGQPSLDDLMVRFLANRADAGIGDASGEVEPHEVAAGFRVDPRTAWADATTGVVEKTPAVPSDWAGLVNQPAGAFAVPMAAGNFPQRVKDLQPLLTKFDPAELRPTGTQFPAQGLSGLRTWIVREAKKPQPGSVLLAAGVARAIGEFDWAEELLTAAEGTSAGEGRAAWENERAALLWHRGRCGEALAIWNGLPETPAVLFNRGMANLFLGKLAEAKGLLAKVVATLPETAGWNALARLYLALAEIHG